MTKPGANSTSKIRWLVLRHAAAVLGTGIIAGVGSALVLGRWLSSLLFQTSPWDLRIIVTMTVLLTITGLVSAWLPARRASRMDPRTTIQEV